MASQRPGGGRADAQVGAGQRAEDEQQHHQRGRQAELQLALAEVILRDLGEVAPEGVGAGDVDGEAIVAAAF